VHYFQKGVQRQKSISFYKQQKENEKPNNFLPISIVLAALIIIGGYIFYTEYKDRNHTKATEKTYSEQPKQTVLTSNIDDIPKLSSDIPYTMKVSAQDFAIPVDALHDYWSIWTGVKFLNQSKEEIKVKNGFIQVILAVKDIPDVQNKIKDLTLDRKVISVGVGDDDFIVVRTYELSETSYEEVSHELPTIYSYDKRSNYYSYRDLPWWNWNADDDYNKKLVVEAGMYKPVHSNNGILYLFADTGNRTTFPHTLIITVVYYNKDKQQVFNGVLNPLVLRDKATPETYSRDIETATESGRIQIAYNPIIIPRDFPIWKELQRIDTANK